MNEKFTPNLYIQVIEGDIISVIMPDILGVMREPEPEGGRMVRRVVAGKSPFLRSGRYL